MSNSPTQKNKLLNLLEEKISECHACPLNESRTNLVFGVGNCDANIMIIGEAPGKDEDEQGVPFCGSSGKILDNAFESSNLSKSDVRITNTVFCRPPDNRDPLPKEVRKCRKFLNYQIRIVNPSVIVTVGKVASERILERRITITKPGEHGKLYKDRVPRRGKGAKQRVVIPCIHPAYFLRQGTKDKAVEKIAYVLNKAQKVVLSLDRKKIEKKTEEVF